MQTPNFTINGTKILDPDGNEFVAIGSNVNGPRGFFTRDTLQDVDMIADVWRFNCVRLITTHGLLWQTEHNTDLLGIVKAFTDKRVVVMIEVHDYTGTYPDENTYYGKNAAGEVQTIRHCLADFADKWVEWAVMFKENPYVWFNIMNEPAGNTHGTPEMPGWVGDAKESCETWYATHKYVISAIRNAGADNIIVLDEHFYGQGRYDENDPDGYGSSALNKGPILNGEFNNLLYSLHPYGWREFKRLNQWVLDCHTRNLAVIFAEYGAVYGDLNTHITTKNLYDTAIPHKIGRLYWSWAGDMFRVCETNGSPDKRGDGYEVDRTDGTKPTNLTWFGNVVWDDAHGTLKAPIQRKVFPLVVNGDFSDGIIAWFNLFNNFHKISIDKGAAHDGNDCAKLSPGGSGYTGQEIDLESFKTDTTYTFSLWAKCGAGDAEPTEVGVAYATGDGAPEKQHTLYFTETEWTRKEITFTTPAHMASARIFVWRPADIDFWFDCVRIEER